MSIDLKIFFDFALFFRTHHNYATERLKRKLKGKIRVKIEKKNDLQAHSLADHHDRIGGSGPFIFFPLVFFWTK